MKIKIKNTQTGKEIPCKSFAQANKEKHILEAKNGQIYKIVINHA